MQFEYNIWHIDDEIDHREAIKKNLSLDKFKKFVKNKIPEKIEDSLDFQENFNINLKSFENCGQWNEYKHLVESGDTKHQRPFVVIIDIGLPHPNTNGLNLLRDMYDPSSCMIKPQYVFCISGQATESMVDELLMHGVIFIEKGQRNYRLLMHTIVDLIADKINKEADITKILISDKRVKIDQYTITGITGVLLTTFKDAVENGKLSVNTIDRINELNYVNEETFKQQFKRIRRKLKESPIQGSDCLWDCLNYSNDGKKDIATITFNRKRCEREFGSTPLIE